MDPDPNLDYVYVRQTSCTTTVYETDDQPNRRVEETTTREWWEKKPTEPDEPQLEAPDKWQYGLTPEAAAAIVAVRAVMFPGSKTAIIAQTYEAARGLVEQFLMDQILTIRDTSVSVEMWNPSTGDLLLTNDSRCKIFSARTPDSLRGPQFHTAWVHEVDKDSRAGQHIRLGLRLRPALRWGRDWALLGIESTGPITV